MCIRRSRWCFQLAIVISVLSSFPSCNTIVEWRRLNVSSGRLQMTSTSLADFNSGVHLFNVEWVCIWYVCCTRHTTLVDLLYVRFRRASTGSLGVALLNVAGTPPFLPGYWGMSVRTTAGKFAALVLLFSLYHTRNFERSPFDSAVAI